MKERYFSTFQLILLALFSALVVVAKISLRTPLQLPGHSGIYWMAIVLVTARVVPKPGATTIVGITSGIIAAFLGMGDFGALDTFLSYAMIGVIADLVLIFLGGNPELLGVAVFVGILGHLGKFLIKWLFGLVSGAPLGFIALGLARSLIGYVLFGALGGVLGWVTIKTLRKAGFFSYLAEKK